MNGKTPAGNIAGAWLAGLVVSTRIGDPDPPLPFDLPAIGCQCEGCGKPATQRDIEGVPLCDGCAEACGEEEERPLCDDELT